MPLPPLPPDVWYRIASFSDPSTLSALSQVNRIFHKLAMHNHHFTRHLPSATTLHPRQAFRRLAALQHPPTHFVTAPLSSHRLVCVAGDAALLFDHHRRVLLAFPGRHAWSTDWLVENAHNAVPPSHNSILSSLVDMRDEFVAFVYRKRLRTTLSIFDLRTGHIRKLALRPFRNTVRDKRRVVFLAGNEGEFIAQRQSNTTLVLFNWRDGSVVREYSDLDDQTAFVRGECLAANGNCIVGYATSKTHQGVKEVSVRGFDGVNTIFSVDANRMVKYVLRSEDTVTHVLVMGESPEESHPTDFIAHSTRSGDTWWSGQLRRCISRLELRENGRVLVNRRLSVKSGNKRTKHPEWPVWLLLKETSEHWGTVETVSVTKVKSRSPPVWMRRIEGREYVLMAGNANGKAKTNLTLVQLRRKGSEIDEVKLAMWTIDQLDQAIVVADHFILATNTTGQLHLLHFNKFCNGRGGVYACPLKGLSTYCLFPEEIRDEDELLQDRKRRRIGEANDCDVVEWD